LTSGKTLCYSLSTVDLTEGDKTMIDLNNRIKLNYSHEPITRLEGEELLNDLFTGGIIAEARNDGEVWYLLVEREIKLKDCKGGEDGTWKYAIYETSKSFEGFYLASQHNRTAREMKKIFDENFWEGRRSVRLIKEGANAPQAT
jgi:hypothetical protein